MLFHKLKKEDELKAINMAENIYKNRENVADFIIKSFIEGFANFYEKKDAGIGLKNYFHHEKGVMRGLAFSAYLQTTVFRVDSALGHIPSTTNTKIEFDNELKNKFSNYFMDGKDVLYTSSSRIIAEKNINIATNCFKNLIHLYTIAPIYNEDILEDETKELFYVNKGLDLFFDKNKK